jgi:hypothetical protein
MKKLLAGKATSKRPQEYSLENYRDSQEFAELRNDSGIFPGTPRIFPGICR